MTETSQWFMEERHDCSISNEKSVTGWKHYILVCKPQRETGGVWRQGGINLRYRELNSNDLQSILYWYNKAFKDDEDDDVEVYQKTLIKVQALAVYAQEEEERFDNLFKRRFKWTF